MKEREKKGKRERKNMNLTVKGSKGTWEELGEKRI